jgi:undecaprenyl-diphosphatase
MNYIHAIILGIVEGITEFLPISSTFHLIFTAKLLGIGDSEFVKVFEVFIQSGAILSVLLLYFKTLWNDRDLMKKVAVSFIPTAVVGLVLHKIIKTIFFETNWLMIGAFFVVAGVFFFIEYLISQKKLVIDQEVKTLSYKQAVVVGLAQSLAVIPGVSRAGSVLVVMMFMKYRRDESARYSFMLSIPTIFAASAKDLFEMREVVFASSDNIGLLTAGFVTAFISSYFVVKWLIGFLQKHSLVTFGWYRILIGTALLLLVGL